MINKVLKGIYLVIMLLTLAVHVSAVTPLKIQFDAILMDENGLIQDIHQVKVGLYKEAGNTEIMATTNTVNFVRGYINQEITLEEAHAYQLSSAKVKIGITIDTKAPIYIDLLSVPYSIQSFYSENAEKFRDAAFINLDRVDDELGIGKWPNYPLDVQGDMRVTGTANAAVFKGKFVGDGSDITDLNLRDNYFLNSKPNGANTVLHEKIVFVDKDGLMGIDTHSPRAQLEVATGNVLFTGSLDSGNEIPSNLGNGTRLIWSAKKGALRAGGISDGSGDWNDDNIGNYSVAFGRNNKASGTESGIGSGQGNKVEGNNSGIFSGDSNHIHEHANNSVIAGGSNNKILNLDVNNEEKGEFSGILSGQANTIYHKHSAILGGQGNEIKSQYSAVLGGSGNKVGVDADYSVALGYKAMVEANHQNTFVWSGTTAEFKSTDSKQFLIDSEKVGINTNDPKATLDINGIMKLKKYGSAPASPNDCNSDRDGAILLNNSYELCVCNGTAWKKSYAPSTNCF